MEKMNITLVNYPYVSSLVKYPIGLLNLKQTLEGNLPDVSVNIIDFNRLINSGEIVVENFKNKDYQLLSSYILSGNPKLIGFSTLAISLDLTLELATYIKNIYPEIKIFLGGPSATVSYQKILKNYDSVDFVLLGESESCINDVVVAAVNGSSFSAIPANIAFRENGKICTQHSASHVDLNQLPYLDLSEYKNLTEIDIEVGRGCPFNCYFCATSIFWHRKYEIKSVQRLISELNYYISTYNVHTFNFIHDLFTFDRDYVISVCNKIIEANLSINWACSSRIDSLDPELVRNMKAAGCTHIFIGIETGSQRMQKIIRKNINLHTIKDTFQWITSFAIGLTVSFVYGFPEETEQDLIETLNLIQYLNDNCKCKIVFTKCTFYPNTDVYIKHATSINTFIPTGDYLSLHKESPTNIILENKDLFPCFFSYDNQAEYLYMDVFINFYIRLICKTLPNVYSSLTNEYNYWDLYKRLYPFLKLINPYTEMLYEKTITPNEYFKLFFSKLQKHLFSSSWINTKIKDAFNFDYSFIKYRFIKDIDIQ